MQLPDSDRCVELLRLACYETHAGTSTTDSAKALWIGVAKDHKKSFPYLLEEPMQAICRPMTICLATLCKANGDPYRIYGATLTADGWPQLIEQVESHLAAADAHARGSTSREKRVNELTRFAWALLLDQSVKSEALALASVLIEQKYGQDTRGKFIGILASVDCERGLATSRAELIEKLNKEVAAKNFASEYAAVRIDKLNVDLHTALKQADQARRQADEARKSLDSYGKQASRWMSLLKPFAEYPTNEFFQALRGAEWHSPRFSADKALACANVASLSYLHLPMLELEGTPRVKLVPSYGYQFLQEHRVTARVDDFVGSVQPDVTSFVIEQERVVIVGVRCAAVILVGIRGTSGFYEEGLGIDAKFWKKRATFVDEFHSGFLETAKEAMAGLEKQLGKPSQVRSIVCFAGHSMGGAVAAICHALWNKEVSPGGPRQHCYSFAMPRYTNAGVLATHRQPFHLFGSKDAVPSLPPQSFGYADVHTECSIDQLGKKKRSAAIGLFHMTKSLASGYGFTRPHSIEAYVANVRKNANAVEQGAAAKWLAWQDSLGR